MFKRYTLLKWALKTFARSCVFFYSTMLCTLFLMWKFSIISTASLPSTTGSPFPAGKELQTYVSFFQILSSYGRTNYSLWIPCRSPSLWPIARLLVVLAIPNRVFLQKNEIVYQVLSNYVIKWSDPKEVSLGMARLSLYWDRRGWRHVLILEGPKVLLISILTL